MKGNPVEDKGTGDRGRSGGLPAPPAWVPWVIITVGLAIRLILYLKNRSIWLDESMIALNILDRSFVALLHPLDHYQYAPVGFLMTVKAATTLFGGSEYALRLVPLLFGSASLLLFHRVSGKLMKPAAANIALGLYALSNTLARSHAHAARRRAHADTLRRRRRLLSGREH